MWTKTTPRPSIARTTPEGPRAGSGLNAEMAALPSIGRPLSDWSCFDGGIDDGQTVAAEPEPAEAVAGKGRDAASVDDDGAGVSFVLAGRVDPQAAVGGDEQVSLVPGDGVQHLQVMGFFLQPLCFRARKDRMVHGARIGRCTRRADLFRGCKPV